jgi:hypothetical protein
MPKGIRRSVVSVPFILLVANFIPGAWAQTPTFTPGNLVVTVEGCGVHGGTCTSVINGTGNGSGNSSNGGYGDNEAGPITLFQYTPNGTASANYVNSLVLPQLGSGANLPVSGEYGSSSEGTLQLDGTGRYLTFMGYGVNAVNFDAAYHPAAPPGNYTSCSSGGYDPYGAAPSGALAQSGSLTGQCYNPVPRVLSLIDPYGNVNSATPIYNIFNTNNPRSVYTIDGTSVGYVSGQGSGSDATGGVFYFPIGAPVTSPTPITGLDTSGNTIAQDTRDVQIYNNTLYVSVDSKEGSGSTRDFIGTLGTPPATSLYSSGAGPLEMSLYNNAGTPAAVSSNGKLTLTASEENSLNSAAVGKTINLSPINYFFASPSVMYVADGGNSKQTSASSLLGDGGLQKWVNVSGKWELEYTLSAGLSLVQNPNANASNTSGATGLYGLAGTVSGNTVYLYATNYNIADLDPTYLYGITDTLSATTNPGTSFTQLAIAPPDSNFKGVSFAPTLPAGSATITSSPSGLAFTSSGSGCASGTYTTPVTLIWTPGSSCTLSVISTQSAPGSTYTFSNWQDGTTATSDAVTAPSTSAVYTATFNTKNTPLGNLESAYDSSTRAATVVQSDSIYISGWTADPGDGAPVSTIKVLVDGTVVGSPATGVSRPDVAVYFDDPNYTNSGYQFTYPASTLSPGTHSVTVTSINGEGNSTTFGPLSITVTGAAPIGNLETAVDNMGGTSTVSQNDSVYVSGWAADYTDGSPLANLKVYVDGQLEGPATTGISRPDVASAYHLSSFANSGFQATFSASSLSVGSHAITVVAVDSGNRSTTLGPLTITVTSSPVASPPFGNLEKAVDNTTGSSTVSSGDSLLISGWVADTVDGSPVGNVKIYIDGALAGPATTGISRPDVAAYYNNSAYANSGYQYIYPASSLSSGSHSATVIAIDSNGYSTTFGPLTFTVQ